MAWIDCDCGNEKDEVKEMNDDVKNYENSLPTYNIYHCLEIYLGFY